MNRLEHVSVGSRVHRFRKKMDCRVEPGNDAELDQSDRNPL
ncbi:MAG TPA: hypothetical protein VGI22_15590 [Xanthobacteraceae bacterium]|jgi:hypothetical protein